MPGERTGGGGGGLLEMIGALTLHSRFALDQVLLHLAKILWMMMTLKVCKRLHVSTVSRKYIMLAYYRKITLS